MDGMSMGQLKPYKKLPSNLLSIEADELAQKQIGDNFLDIDGMAKKVQVDRKEDNYGEDVGNPIAGGATTSSEEENTEDDELVEDEDESFEKHRYSIHYNEQLNLIELFDNEKNEVVDIITEENFKAIVSKLNYASGLIVTKKI